MKKNNRKKYVIPVVVIIILLMLLLKSCQLQVQSEATDEEQTIPSTEIVNEPGADTILNGSVDIEDEDAPLAELPEVEIEQTTYVIRPIIKEENNTNKGSDNDEVVIIEDEEPPKAEIPIVDEIEDSKVEEKPAETPSAPAETEPSKPTTDYSRPYIPSTPIQPEPPIEEEKPAEVPPVEEEVPPAEDEPAIETPPSGEDKPSTDDILKDLQDKLDEAIKALEDAEGDEEKAKENLKDIFENADDSELEEFIDKTQDYLSAVNNKSSIEIIDILTSVIELGGFGEDLFNENGTLSSTDTNERAHVIHDIMEYIEFVAEEETGDYTFLISSSDGNCDIYFVADNTDGKDNVGNVLVYNVNEGSWAIGSMNVKEDGSLDSDSYFYYDTYWERYMFDSLDDLRNELAGSNDIAQEEFEDSIINSDEYQEALGDLDQATQDKEIAQDTIDSIQGEIDSLLGESSIF